MIYTFSFWILSKHKLAEILQAEGIMPIPPPTFSNELTADDATARLAAVKQQMDYIKDEDVDMQDLRGPDSVLADREVRLFSS